jgi:hypothetical protein
VALSWLWTANLGVMLVLVACDRAPKLRDCSELCRQLATCHFLPSILGRNEDLCAERCSQSLESSRVELTDCRDENCDYLAACLVAKAPDEEVIGVSRVSVEIPNEQVLLEPATEVDGERAVCTALARQEQFGIVRASPSRSCEGFEWLFRGLYPGPAEIGIRRVTTGACDDYVLTDYLEANDTAEAIIPWAEPDSGVVTRRGCPPCGDNVEHPERLPCSNPACVFDPLCIEPNDVLDEPTGPKVPPAAIFVETTCSSADAASNAPLDAARQTTQDASARTMADAGATMDSDMVKGIATDGPNATRAATSADVPPPCTTGAIE